MTCAGGSVALHPRCFPAVHSGSGFPEGKPVCYRETRLAVKKVKCSGMPALPQTQSHLRYPLTSMLGSAGSVRVLRALVADRSPQSAPQLATVAGLTPQGVRLVLGMLARQQLVVVHGSGRTQRYALKSSHPFYGPLVALFQEEQRRWDALLESICDVLTRRGRV